MTTTILWVFSSIPSAMWVSAHAPTIPTGKTGTDARRIATETGA